MTKNGQLIGDGTDHFALFIGYMIGAVVMIIGALFEVVLGLDAERRSLEDIALLIGLQEGAPSPYLANVTGAPRAPAARTLLSGYPSDRPDPDRDGTGGAS